MYKILTGACYMGLKLDNSIEAKYLLPFAGFVRSNKRIKGWRETCLQMGLISFKRKKTFTGFSGYSYVYSITDKGWDMYREFCEALGIESGK